MKAYFQTKNFIKHNDGIIFTRADKGNVTVALSRDRYISEMKALLSDIETYMLIDKDPLLQIKNDLQSLLKRWLNKNYISKSMYLHLNATDFNLPRAYGLPKIHKQGKPLRIIVSSIKGPLYHLTTYLHNIIYNSVPKAHSHIANSFDLVNKLSGLHIDEHFELISLDVSLFTNVPL